MQGTPMNKNRPMRQASGGTWNLYFVYNDMAAILIFFTSLMLFIIYA